MSTSTLHLGIFYMPQICDMGPTALLPLRRKACWGFFRPLKIRWLRPGLNPRTWVLKASTLLLDHRSRYMHYMQRILLAIINADFNTTGQLLNKYPALVASSSSSVGATTLGGFWPALRFCSTIFYLNTSLFSFSLSSSLHPLLLGQAISVLVFLLVLMNMVPIQWVFQNNTFEKWDYKGAVYQLFRKDCDSVRRKGFV